MTVRLTGPPRREGVPAVDRRLLQARARQLLRELSKTRSELSIALVDDAEIRSLNASYRGKRRPTDVLAFSLLEGEGAEHRGGLLGDVVIGVEAAARQARARHRRLDEEIARLLIHGTLHLIGYDHQRREEARTMRAQERRLWRAIRTGDG